jgi:nucleotide-binding universal stress UspA family protein
LFRSDEGVAARALEFTILTAARTGEVIGATWPMAAVLARMGQRAIIVHGFRSTFRDWASERTPDGVVADVIVPEAVDDATERLDLIASDIGADLVVAGAYGHTRLEWLFAGVTRDLVSRSTRCAVLAH